MMNLDDILERWIPYRLQAIQTLQFAWQWISESQTTRRVEVFVDGRLKLRGNVAALANPMIEAGVIHARALLEFMGLCSSNGRLSQVASRRRDDIAIEHYSTPTVRLSTVGVADVLATYAGSANDAETALVAIFAMANKGLAHLTLGIATGEYTDEHIDIACRGIPVLLHNHLYAKLGRSVPEPPAAVPNDG